MPSRPPESSSWAETAAVHGRPAMAAGAGPAPGRPARPLIFGVGVAMVTVGVVMHVVEFVQMRLMGMPTSEMGMLGSAGMAIDLSGLLLAAWGIMPHGFIALWRSRRTAQAEAPLPAPVADHGALAALDSSRLTGAHLRLIVLLYVGLSLDAIKPATIAFQLPGMTAEYHLLPAEAAIFPLSALVGTTVGSLLFGVLIDLIGRRTSFVLTALILSATAVCGLMPGFPYQVSMCFVMGLAAGGVLPVVYTLLAETMPARHRGWLSVAVGGVGGLSGFLLAGTTAWLLEPLFTWRVLFLPNLPTSLIILLLIRWIPESPRFLLQTGHAAAAHEAMAQVGIGQVVAAEPVASAPEVRGIRAVFQGRLRHTTLMLCLYGFAWGLCNWGFITWLPTMLRGMGQDVAFTNKLLATAAFFALPGTLAAAVLYGLWSSKRAAVLFALGTGAVLAFFGLASPVLAHQTDLITIAVIGLLISSSSMIGVIAPYSVEVYPTSLRGIGSGVVAASTKAGGVVGPAMIGGILTFAPGLAIPALVISVPLGIAGIMVAFRGVETRGRRLEELASAALGR